MYTPKRRAWPPKEVRAYLLDCLGEAPFRSYPLAGHCYVVSDGMYKIHAQFIHEPSYQWKQRIHASLLQHHWVPSEGKGTIVPMSGRVSPTSVRRYKKGHLHLTIIPGGMGGFVAQMGDDRYTAASSDLASQP